MPHVDRRATAAVSPWTLAVALVLAISACAAPSGPRADPVTIRAAVDQLSEAFADLAQEAGGDGRRLAVGVLDFSSAEGPSALGYLLAHELSSSLAQEFRGRELDNISVITRLHVEDLLLEQGLSLTDMFATDESPSVGQLLGADYLVTGLLTSTPYGVRVSTQFLSVNDGVTLGGETLAIAPNETRGGLAAPPATETARRSSSSKGTTSGETPWPTASTRDWSASTPTTRADPRFSARRAIGSSNRELRALAAGTVDASGLADGASSEPGRQPPLLAVARTHEALLVGDDGHAVTDVGVFVTVGSARAAPALPARVRRSDGRDGNRPIHVCLAVDTSGSMSEYGRLEFARTAAEEVLADLDDDDTVTLITFSDRSRVTVRPLYATPQAKNIIVAAMARLVAGGKTNFESALSEARRCFRMTRDRHDVGYMVLLSDGIPTMGALDPLTLGDVARDMALLGVSVDTVGVGREINIQAMETIALKGNGRFRAVTDDRMLVDAVRGSVAGAVDRQAEAAQLVFRPAQGVVADDVVGTWNSGADGTLTADLGLIRRGEDRTRQLHLVPAAPLVTGARVALGRFELTYRDPYGDDHVETHEVVAGVVNDRSGWDLALNRSVVFELHRTELQTVLGQAYDMAVAGRLEAAADVIAAAVQRHEAFVALAASPLPGKLPGDEGAAAAPGAQPAAWEELVALIERARATSTTLSSGRFPQELRSSLYRDAVGASGGN